MPPALQTSRRCLTSFGGVGVARTTGPDAKEHQAMRAVLISDHRAGWSRARGLGERIYFPHAWRFEALSGDQKHSLTDQDWTAPRVATLAACRAAGYYAVAEAIALMRCARRETLRLAVFE